MSKSNLILWTLKNRNFKEITKRITDVFFGWMIRPFSFITPRNKKKWLIGNKTGWGDNSKYLALFLSQNNPENVRIIWIAKNRAERDTVRAKGLEAYTKWSLSGVFHGLTAGAYFYSSSISDINYWTSGNVYRMNMWHGVGLKKLGRKQSTTYNPHDISTHILTPFFYNQPTYFIGPSDMMAKHFADCYNMSDKQMLKIGYPRCDFITQSQEEICKHISKYESEKMADLISRIRNFSKVYIYMPTFRDDQHDFIKESGIDFEMLNSILEKHNSIFLLKLHPATRIGNLDLEKFNNIITIDKNLDIYPILPFTDTLITDYSSIYYDYILMRNKNVILFPFDYKEYVSKSRDFAFDYLTNTAGIKVWNFQELYEIISSEKNIEIEGREEIINKFWGDEYASASNKIK
ncbi:MAG: CDP-glycerol glycerophosphotransferase family protein, partial [Muribaculaceae bacterium]|nr:CDP-glycerol glycerophosphotransferase family protein [Muribaculaceae bacterium]